ncbi:MAG: DUF4129 domain-containing protein [Acidobacteria bacterium]|nr:DUF4129 domain-containing protein [Acidobacteriota bacterium]
MIRRKGLAAGKSAIELIEEAVWLLRGSPPLAYLVYSVGTVPFLLGLLYFWGDMSRSGSAYAHAPEAALSMAVLYSWMKVWHSVYAGLLMASATGGAAPEGWSLARAVRLSVAQTALQPTSFIALPLAFLFAIPFGWVYAFYHNLSVYGDGRRGSLREVARDSKNQAILWPMQNHMLILLLWLFGLFVFLNLITALMLAPYLLKMFAGIETVFTRGGLAFLNTTLLAAACSLSYLVMNPLVKAVYVLRCFHGDSLRTGEDIRVEMRSFAAKPIVGAAVLCAALACVDPADLCAAPAPPAPQAADASGVQAAELEKSVEEVLARREYTWRLPREKVDEVEEKGLVSRFIRAVANVIMDASKAVGRWFADILRWLRDLLTPDEQRIEDQGGGGIVSWILSSTGLLYILLALVMCVAGVLVWRLAQSRNRTAAGQLVPLPGPGPDIAAESTTADQQPAEEWIAAAAQLMARGEWRLAMRALYLASLALLAQQSLVTLARYKSNRDYLREVQRRGRPEIAGLFSENMSAFERVWYGRHEATEQIVEQFDRNLERLRGHAKA